MQALFPSPWFRHHVNLSRKMAEEADAQVVPSTYMANDMRAWLPKTDPVVIYPPVDDSHHPSRWRPKDVLYLGKGAYKGADIVLDPNAADLAEQVRKRLPDGVDFIIDATGEPAAVQQAVPLLAKGGTFLIFGVCPAGSSVMIDPHEIYQKEGKIIASKMPPHTLDRAARLIESGRIACPKIVTVTFGLDKLAEAVAGFNDYRESQVKVAIDPWS